MSEAGAIHQAEGVLQGLVSGGRRNKHEEKGEYDENSDQAAGLLPLPMARMMTPMAKSMS
jgi:hypothetical protein